MDIIFRINWEEMFVPTASIAEMVMRGTLVYLGLLSLLRLVLKRQAGTLGITDLLVVVLIADAAQNAMASQYKSIFEGLIIVGTIIFWSYFLNLLGYYFPRFQRFIHPDPLPLVKEGQLQQHNMRKDLITEDELMNQLRLQGVEQVSEVKRAYIEGDGRISVIPKDSDRGDKVPESRTL